MEALVKPQMSNVSKITGEDAKKLRQKLGLTQEDLAQLMKIKSKTQICRGELTNFEGWSQLALDEMYKALGLWQEDESLDRIWGICPNKGCPGSLWVPSEGNLKVYPFAHKVRKNQPSRCVHCQTKLVSTCKCGRQVKPAQTGCICGEIYVTEPKAQAGEDAKPDELRKLIQELLKDDDEDIEKHNETRKSIDDLLRFFEKF